MQQHEIEARLLALKDAAVNLINGEYSQFIQVGVKMQQLGMLFDYLQGIKNCQLRRQLQALLGESTQQLTEYQTMLQER